MCYLYKILLDNLIFIYFICFSFIILEISFSKDVLFISCHFISAHLMWATFLSYVTLDKMTFD